MLSLLIASLAGIAMPVVPRFRQEAGERRDPRRELELHYRALLPISAAGRRQCEYSREGTPPETLEWIARHYEGAALQWRRDDRAIYALDLTPKNEPRHAALYVDGATIGYDYTERHAAKEMLYAWNGDLYPDAYFLDLPPVPFRHFLSTAELSSPTTEEAASGARDVLIIHHPGLEHHQSLRVALSPDPLRVLAIDWRYQGADGSDVLVERYRFSEWITVNGQPFPTVHRKDAMAGNVVDTTRRLTLTDVGAEPVPADLVVPSGSTYAAPDRGDASRLVGGVTAKKLGDVVEAMSEWTISKQGARIFVHPSVVLRDSIAALRSSRPRAPDVPLQSADASYECGPNCLSLALALQIGESADYRAVDAALELASSGGTNVRQLSDAAQHAGLYASAVRGRLDDLLAYQLPMILPVKVHSEDAAPRHFVLLAGQAGELPILMNPPSPAFVANLAWLDANWGGDALILSKEPIRAPRRVGFALLAGGVMLLAALVAALRTWKRREAPAAA